MNKRGTRRSFAPRLIFLGGTHASFVCVTLKHKNKNRVKNINPPFCESRY